MKRPLLAIVSLCTVLIASTAHATGEPSTWPASWLCSNNDATCFGVTATGTQSQAIVGISSAVGVKGSGTVTGVSGLSTSGQGVFGSSTNGNAALFDSTNNDATYGKAHAASACGGRFTSDAATSACGIVAVASGPGSYGAYIAGNLYVSGTISNPSDRTLKTDVRPLKDSTGILALDGVLYRYIDQSIAPGDRAGLIAQDVEKVYPELVKRDPRSGKLTVEYLGLIPRLIERAKLDNARITALEARTPRSASLFGEVASTASLTIMGAALLYGVYARRRRC